MAKRPGSGVLVLVMDGMTQFGTRMPFKRRTDFGDACISQHLIDIIVFAAMGLFGDVDNSFNLAFLLYGHLVGVGDNTSVELLIRSLCLL